MKNIRYFLFMLTFITLSCTNVVAMKRPHHSDSQEAITIKRPRTTPNNKTQKILPTIRQRIDQTLSITSNFEGFSLVCSDGAVIYDIPYKHLAQAKSLEDFIKKDNESETNQKVITHWINLSVMRLILNCMKIAAEMPESGNAAHTIIPPLMKEITTAVGRDIDELIYIKKITKPLGFILFNNACNKLIDQYTLQSIYFAAPKNFGRYRKTTNPQKPNTKRITLVCDDGVQINNVPYESLKQSKKLNADLSQITITQETPIELLVHDVDSASLRVLVTFMQLATDVSCDAENYHTDYYDMISHLKGRILDSIAPCQYFDSYALQELLKLSRLLDIPDLYFALSRIAGGNPAT